MGGGELTVVGTGIRLTQITVEARAAIDAADTVFFLVADPVTARWIRERHPGAESLQRFYQPHQLRRQSYVHMAEWIVARVRQGKRVCAVFYGHPGVFCYPSHEAVRRARREGFRARMLPGISAEDCLFADLGVNPSRSGCQSFEATDFLIYRRRFDPSSALILWQAGVLGELGYQKQYDLGGLRVLAEVLGAEYAASHSVVLYEAASLAVCEPVIQRLRLDALPGARVTPISTLYVPPKGPASLDLDMVARLRMDAATFGAARAAAQR
jgi:precorrin-6B methylase 1